MGEGKITGRLKMQVLENANTENASMEGEGGKIEHGKTSRPTKREDGK